ncbi:hypothetical protein TCE0_022f06954 [Talaromyces pinophilus]|jgi:sugar porter (SP) family MFS transporter|uniref:Quinate transporter n=1 Tax=Talaromyces pinophilus TaxID=128442 RepID=A0A6V8H7X3_TALPI|nr:putative quinate permease [Talaromyces pinophilus]GAM37220.1 hypothetical protein TCE0_022f06954 [Talaromyces pinophilus]
MPLLVMGFLTPRDLSSGDVPKEIYNFRIYLLAFCASMGSAMFGYDSAFIGGSIGLASFKSRFNFTNASPSAKSALSANIVSTFQAGCFFGCILCWLITRKLGRRSILMICGALFNVGVILEIASPGILGLIYAGRVVTGLAVGASSMIIPTYISECAPPALRGRLVGIFEIFIQVSQIVGFWVNYGVQLHISNSSDTQWRLPFGLQFVPGTLLLFTMPFQPESPRWLMQKNCAGVARKSLARIRKLPEDHPYVNWEIELINSQIVEESERNPSTIINHLKGPFTAKIWPRLLIGMALMLLQNLSGINALNYYSPTIFQSIGLSGDSVKLLATGIFGIVKTVTTMVYMIFIIDRFGRRVPMLVGSVGAAFAMYYLGAYTAKSGSFSGEVPKDGGAYIAIVMIYVFAVFYAFSWNGIPWIFW